MSCLGGVLELLNLERSKPHSGTKEAHGGGRSNHVGKILVVGGAGYIGSVLVRRLLDDGCEVRVLDQLLFGDHSIRPLAGRERFQFIEGDFRDARLVAEAARGVDALIHLGAIVGDPACQIDESATLETNYAATELLTQACRDSGIGRMLFASTCSVYGVTESVAGEGAPLKPLSLYAQTKTDSEKVVLASKSQSFHPTVLRIGTVFGWSPRPRFDLAVNLLTARAYYERRIAIYNRRQWRPFVHVADVAKAFRLVLKAPLPDVSGQVFNLGANQMNCRLEQVGEAVRQIYPGAAVEHETNSDTRTYRVCFDKIEQVLGFRSTRTLADGVREIHGALTQGLAADPSSPIYHNHKLLSLPGNELNKQFSALRAAHGTVAASDVAAGV